MPSSEAVQEYYQRKGGEYLGKYGVGGHTHAHVGQYSRSTQPELFREGWVSPRLGPERLRYLMHSGQERNAGSFLEQITARAPFKRVLDCGAGMGGTSWLIADRYECEVDALSISPHQIDYMNVAFSRAELTDYIHPILGDAFESTWWHGNPYDLVVGFESFCQMGSLSQLLHNLSGLQQPGAILAVSDHFMRSKTSYLAGYFDDYWVSDSSELAFLLDALTLCDYEIVAIADRSDGQVPYWRLSQAYSALPEESRNEDRRSETLRFHAAMEMGYVAGDVHYYQLIARKSQ